MNESDQRKKEVTKMVKNQVRKSNLHDTHSHQELRVEEMCKNQGLIQDEEIEDQDVAVRDNVTWTNKQEVEENDYQQYLTIEIEHEYNNNMSNLEYAGGLLSVVK